MPLALIKELTVSACRKAMILIIETLTLRVNRRD